MGDSEHDLPVQIPDLSHARMTAVAGDGPVPKSFSTVHTDTRYADGIGHSL